MPINDNAVVALSRAEAIAEPVQQTLPYTDILGSPVSALTMDRALSVFETWFAERRGGYVLVRDIHGIMRAHDEPDLLRISRQAAMITPDGMPLVWLSQRRGHEWVRRVCGPDLMPALCERTANRGIRHFFYGGGEGVAESVAANLQTRYPGLEVVGAESPPFRPLTTEESDAIAARIEAADPHVVWVGISTPKQDRWMAAHAPRLPKTVFIGVGAAFDFQVDKVKRAPRWMQRNGMEWFYRLMSEPRRLWQRYLILGPRFAIEVAREARRSRGVRKRSCRSLDSI